MKSRVSPGFPASKAVKLVLPLQEVRKSERKMVWGVGGSDAFSSEHLESGGAN